MFYDVMHFTFQVFAVEIFLLKGRLFENLLIKEIKISPALLKILLYFASLEIKIIRNLR